MSEFYLNDCLDEFDQLIEEKYGEVGKFQEIEKNSVSMRGKKVSIEEICKHFQPYEKQKWFRLYWLWPSIESLSEKKSKICDFGLLDSKELEIRDKKLIITLLLDAFRQIELVALILRFVCPKDFGIFAPPVPYMLSMPSQENAIETYWVYLQALSEIQNHYGFSTICDTENALWVLQHRCSNGRFKDTKIKQAFEQDDFMLKMRAKNMTVSLKTNMPARVAAALFGRENELAALVGCYALEKHVRTYAKRQQVEGQIRISERNLRMRLRALHEKTIGFIDEEQIEVFARARNTVFHGNMCELRILDELISFALMLEKRLANR